MELSRLYYGKGGEKKFQLFLRKNEERILSLLPDDISTELSVFFLSRGELKDRKLLEALSLVRGMSVTESGERILSAYPLFGSGKEERGNYSVEFFPFLFSLISKGMVPFRYQRFISSSAFTSLFPWRDSSLVTYEAEKTIEALLSFGLIAKNSNKLILDKKAALTFMEKDELYRLAHVLSPSPSASDRQKTKDFISLALLINGVEEDRIHALLAFISSVTGSSISLSTLIGFSILREEDGKYTASDIFGEKGKAIVSGDMTISSRFSSYPRIFLIAEPVKADSLNQWTITRSGIRTALDWGMKGEDIIAALSSCSSSPIPESVVDRILSWIKEYERVHIERGVMVTVDERLSAILEALPALSCHIISHPSPCCFFMNGENEEEWRDVLSSLGMDMLPETVGPLFNDEHNPPILSTLSPSPTLPLHRAVEYNEVEYGKTLSNTKEEPQRSLVESHLLFSSKSTIQLEWVDGLFYEEKRETTLSTIADGDCLIIEWVDGSTMIRRPLSLKEDGEEAILVTDKGDLKFSKIWRLAPLPGFIRREDSDSLDSDNL